MKSFGNVIEQRRPFLISKAWKKLNFREMSSASITNCAQLSPADPTSHSQKKFSVGPEILYTLQKIFSKCGAFQRWYSRVIWSFSREDLESFVKIPIFWKKTRPFLVAKISSFQRFWTLEAYISTKTVPNDFILFSRDALRSQLSNAPTLDLFGSALKRTQSCPYFCRPQSDFWLSLGFA